MCPLAGIGNPYLNTSIKSLYHGGTDSELVKSVMTPRQLLSPQAHVALFDPPTEVRAIVRHYTLSIEDLALIRQRRRNANRFGFAVHLYFYHLTVRLLASQECAGRTRGCCTEFVGGAMFKRYRLRQIILFGAPPLVGMQNLAHPIVRVPVYDGVLRQLDRWIMLHIPNIAGFPLLGLAAYLLVRDLRNASAALAKIGVAVFVPVYTAFDVLAGVGTGTLVRQVSCLSPDQRAIFKPSAIYVDVVIRTKRQRNADGNWTQL